MALAGVLWFWGVKYLERDTRLASQRLADIPTPD